MKGLSNVPKNTDEHSDNPFFHVPIGQKIPTNHVL